MNNDKFKNKHRVESKRLEIEIMVEMQHILSLFSLKIKNAFLGNVIYGKMKLLKIVDLSNKYCLEISSHFIFVKLDTFIIIPNHIAKEVSYGF